MLAKLLLAPFLIACMVFLYLAWEVNSDYSLYLLPSAVCLVGVYLFSPQINWWWYKWYPPDLPGKLRHLLNSQLPFYQNLSVEEKTRFRQRVAMYMEANEFMPQGMEEVPPDLKAAVATSVVQLTFGLDDFLLSKFEHVIVYPHPFPSPQYPDKWHTCEHFEEDGVIMFSAQHLMAGLTQPNLYLHIGLYEYARVFRLSYPNEPYPSFGPEVWEKFQRISNFPKEAIEKWIGLPEVDSYAVAVVHFFVFPKKFRAVMPGEYEAVAGIFRQYPAGQ